MQQGHFYPWAIRLSLPSCIHNLTFIPGLSDYLSPPASLPCNRSPSPEISSFSYFCSRDTFIPGLSDYLSPLASQSCKNIHLLHFHKTFNLMQNSRHDLILYCQTKFQVIFFFTSFSVHNNMIFCINTKLETNNENSAVINGILHLFLITFIATLLEMITLSFLHPLTFSKIPFIASPGNFP